MLQISNEYTDNEGMGLSNTSSLKQTCPEKNIVLDLIFHSFSWIAVIGHIKRLSMRHRWNMEIGSIEERALQNRPFPAGDTTSLPSLMLFLQHANPIVDILVPIFRFKRRITP